jgi:putative glutamine amidotransferase
VKPKHPPVIGIPYSEMAARDTLMKVRTYVTRKYYGALQEAGARVLLLPPVAAASEIEWYLGQVDGLLLAGGEDLDPRWQKEDPHPGLGMTNPLRDGFEIALTQAAWARRLPILAICRGLQVAAVALGGALHQDLKDVAAIQHEQNAPRWSTSHRVRVVAGSLLHRWTGSSELFVNSFHHQAVKRLPEGCRVTAEAGDGVVEAMESCDDRWFLGVQWHPEELVRNEEPAAALFREFVGGVAPHELAPGNTRKTTDRHR